VTVATLSPRARRDLAGAMRWIAEDNPIAAQGLVEAVAKAAARIGTHPQIGAVRPDLTTGPYRFVILTGYRYVIAYAPNRDPPLILRILHTSRDLPRVLRNLR
jgi:toxin ParE1/3/4